MFVPRNHVMFALGLARSSGYSTLLEFELCRPPWPAGAGEVVGGICVWRSASEYKRGEGGGEVPAGRVLGSGA